MMEKLIDLLQVADDAAGGLPQAARIFRGPVRVALDRHAVARQVEALAVLPVRPEDRRDMHWAGRPAVPWQRRVALHIPWLRGDWVLAIARALKPKTELQRGVWPRRCGDRDDHVRPVAGDVRPVAGVVPPAALGLAAAEFRRGE